MRAQTRARVDKLLAGLVSDAAEAWGRSQDAPLSLTTGVFPNGPSQRVGLTWFAVLATFRKAAVAH